jgi:hypothetical protein
LPPVARNKELRSESANWARMGRRADQRTAGAGLGGARRGWKGGRGAERPLGRRATLPAAPGRQTTNSVLVSVATVGEKRSTTLQFNVCSDYRLALPQCRAEGRGCSDVLGPSSLRLRSHSSAPGGAQAVLRAVIRLTLPHSASSSQQITTTTVFYFILSS